MPKRSHVTTLDQQSYQLTLNDDALVSLGPAVGPGSVSFHDAGYMPVNELTVGGNTPESYGRVDGLFIKYVANGVQHFAAPGVPTTANYTDLQYQLVGYRGDATFGHLANGTPTVTGIHNQIVLAQGNLLAGQLDFTANGGIAGEVDVSVQISGHIVGRLDISVQHAASDIGYPSANSLSLSGGTLHATYVPLSGS